MRNGKPDLVDVIFVMVVSSALGAFALCVYGLLIETGV